MVGLSVVLESQRCEISKKTPQVISKTMINKHHSASTTAASLNSQHSVFQEATFLDSCFLCSKRLLPGNDIYMYKGDKAFCSVECRCKQIFMDEEEIIQKKKKKNCSMTAMRPTSSGSNSSSSSSEAPHHHQKGARNPPGGFAY